MMRINRTPIDETTMAQILDQLKFPEDLGETIGLEDVYRPGKAIIHELEVEGEPAHGVVKHNTRYGRQWCAYRTED